MKTVYRLCFLFLLGSLVLGSGCSSGPELPADLPKLIPCVVTLTQEGAPLDGASVSLILTDGGQQWYPGGLSDQNGKVELYTNGRYKGAPEGKYKVVVNKTETDPSKFGPAPSEDDPAYGDWMDKTSREKLDSYTLVEKTFNKAETTTLEVDIAQGMSDLPVLDVGKKVKIKL